MEDRSEYYNFLVNLGMFLESELGETLVKQIAKYRDNQHDLVVSNACKIVTERDLIEHKDSLMKAASLKKAYNLILESELLNLEALNSLKEQIKQELQLSSGK